MESLEYSVKVSGIPRGTTANELRDVFAQKFSTVTDVYQPARFAKFDFAFVRFSSPEDAHDAVDMEGLMIQDSLLICELATSHKKKALGGGHDGGAHDDLLLEGASRGLGDGEEATGQRYGEYSIWLGGLPDGTSIDDVGQALATQGILTFTDLYIPPNRHFGFVRFASREEAEEAVTCCDGLQIDGQPITFKFSTSKKRISKGARCRGVPHLVPSDFSPFPSASCTAPPRGCGGAGGSEREFSVKVGIFASGTTVEDVTEALSLLGIHAVSDIYIPKGKRFGFVRFRSYDEALTLLQKGGLRVKGKRAEVELAVGSKRTPEEMTPGADTASRMDDIPKEITAGADTASRVDEVLKAGCASSELDCGWTWNDASSGGPRMTRRPSRSPGNSRASCPRPWSDHGFGEYKGHGGFEGKCTCEGCSYGVACHFDNEDHCIMDMYDLYGWGGHVDDPFKSPYATKCHPSKGVYTDIDDRDEHGSSEGKGELRSKKGKAAKRGRQGNEVSIKVGNLPEGTRPDELCDAFIAQGIDSMTDCYIPFGKRFGFVRFMTPAEGHAVLKRGAQGLFLKNVRLQLEAALGSKRSSEEMLLLEDAPRGPPNPPGLRSGSGSNRGRMAPDDPNVSANTPSVKFGGLPPGTTSEELHAALVAAGCKGRVIDVYVPRGNRGFGFVRFPNMDMAFEACNLLCGIHGHPLSAEIAVQSRKTKCEEDDHPQLDDVPEVVGGGQGGGRGDGHGPHLQLDAISNLSGDSCGPPEANLSFWPPQ